LIKVPQSKVPICTVLYNEQLTFLRRSGMARLSTSGMNHTCLYSPAAEHQRPLACSHFTVPRRVQG